MLTDPDQEWQAEGRPAREAKKRIDYSNFNEVSRMNLDLDDSDSEVELFRVTHDSRVLVEETPLTTPVDPALGETEVVPETQEIMEEVGSELDLDPHKMAAGVTLRCRVCLRK